MRGGATGLGVGVGGPDLMPYRPGQLHHSYPLIEHRPKVVVAGVAVQWGNLDPPNPETCYSRDVLSFLEGLTRQSASVPDSAKRRA